MHIGEDQSLITSAVVRIEEAGERLLYVETRNNEYYVYLLNRA